MAGTEADEPTANWQGNLVFTSLEEFVAEYLTQVVHRRLNRASCLWCPDWWRHPEAIARLSVLWRAFEYLRLDPALGLSIWWTQHADPHLLALMHPVHGPFTGCDPRDGHSDAPPDPLPSTPPPGELRRHPAFALQPEDTSAGVDASTPRWPTPPARSRERVQQEDSLKKSKEKEKP